MGRHTVSNSYLQTLADEFDKMWVDSMIRSMDHAENASRHPNLAAFLKRQAAKAKK